MPLHVRKRRGVWYARGTVRVGSQTVEVPEYSTGCRNRSDAEAQAGAREAEIRQSLLNGGIRKLTIADCILAYLARPGGVKPYDQDRLFDFNTRIGGRPTTEASAAWAEWLGSRGADMAPTTVARWRAILQSAITYGCTAQDLVAPRLPGVKQPKGERLVYLSKGEAEVLLAAYSPSAGHVALALAYQGLRTSEALRLDWRRVNWDVSTIHIAHEHEGDARTKTGLSRTVPLHPRVRERLQELWEQRGMPKSGTVFLNRVGQPYADNRLIGGNPLTKAHTTACRKVGISGFTIHDWRHHWASHLVMSGCDLVTLRQLGGWESMSMVKRYALVTPTHMAEAIARL